MYAVCSRLAGVFYMNLIGLFTHLFIYCFFFGDFVISITSSSLTFLYWKDPLGSTGSPAQYSSSSQDSNLWAPFFCCVQKAPVTRFTTSSKSMYEMHYFQNDRQAINETYVGTMSSRIAKTRSMAEQTIISLNINEKHAFQRAGVLWSHPDHI